jgi:hypothetical protein
MFANDSYMASMAVKCTAISSLHIAKFTILFLIFLV